MTTQRLDPAEVPEAAVIDTGVPGVWPTLINPNRLIPTLWRKVTDLTDAVTELRGVVAELAEELHAVETVLGTNPHDGHDTVADRLTEIEARQPTIEKHPKKI